LLHETSDKQVNAANARFNPDANADARGDAADGSALEALGADSVGRPGRTADLHSRCFMVE
jgi:hypothetical protein